MLLKIVQPDFTQQASELAKLLNVEWRAFVPAWTHWGDLTAADLQALDEEDYEVLVHLLGLPSAIAITIQSELTGAASRMGRSRRAPPGALDAAWFETEVRMGMSCNSKAALRHWPSLGGVRELVRVLSLRAAECIVLHKQRMRASDAGHPAAMRRMRAAERMRPVLYRMVMDKALGTIDFTAIADCAVQSRAGAAAEAESPAELSAEQRSWLSKDVDDLPLEGRIVKTLDRGTVTTVRRLVSGSRVTRRVLAALGPEDIEEIRQALEGIGLSLSMKID